MATTIKIDPLTRIEGHLAIEVIVDTVDNVQQVLDAKSSGTMFRGFEIILRGRDPFDAPHYTQRICGVCPISHGMASCMTLEDALGVTPPPNGRIMRNLVLGANFIMSHILHFYHLAALDYINTEDAIPMPPWVPAYVTPDMVTGEKAATLVSHYVDALAIRRKAHQMAAIFGGKLPCAPSFVPGGCTEVPTQEKIDDFRALLTELRTFIGDVGQGTYIPDVLTVAGAFPQYYNIGKGCGNLLAYGVFDLNASGSKLLHGGRLTDGVFGDVYPTQIREYLRFSKYDGAALNPANGVTVPDANKEEAYSWLKAPRYDDKVYETGPLARITVNGGYPTDIIKGISVLDRHAARALEAKLVADSMVGWLEELEGNLDGPVYAESSNSTSGTGIGLTEAPRGALGHWITIRSRKIDRYQVVTPTNWNASPMDDLGQLGPIEQALKGTPVADLNQPIEILRVVHSFDPCLACSVHMLRPGKDKPVAIVHTRPSI
ncbi:MAG: nickel-dependent hydrogenase large subunit [Chloroflexi bacterium]|nr:nickel-dependent hydrogenase large subunit [Chloroflexota bacterium]MBL7146940.1 nickel-dependent hydrogenase large subunit [Phycisphaerae bacterium]